MQQTKKQVQPTPGPWWLENRGTNHDVLRGRNDVQIGTVLSSPEHEADRNLIKAAHDLLELAELAARAEDMDPDQLAYLATSARIVLAKARGEQGGAA